MSCAEKPSSRNLWILKIMFLLNSIERFTLTDVVTMARCYIFAQLFAYFGKSVDQLKSVKSSL